MGKVIVVMGSKSDWDVMKECEVILNEFGVEVESRVVSAHRTPHLMYEFAQDNDADVIIAGAGGAAHLPGMIASLTVQPVIAVPVKSKALNGVDSLLSMVQMPGGVPVACVAINGAKNAGILAVSILAVNDEKLREKLQQYKTKIANESLGSVL